MSFINGMIAGILIYTLLGLLAILIFKMDEDVSIWWCAGIWILLFMIFGKCYVGIINFMNAKKYKSIVADKQGNLYQCEYKYFNDFFQYHYIKDKMKRYTKKSEWKQLPKVPVELLEEATRNCDHCVYNEKECTDDNPLCKHNEYDEVIEYDKFERNGKKKQDVYL